MHDLTIEEGDGKDHKAGATPNAKKTITGKNGEIGVTWHQRTAEGERKKGLGDKFKASREKMRRG